MILKIWVSNNVIKTNIKKYMSILLQRRVNMFRNKRRRLFAKLGLLLCILIIFSSSFNAASVKATTDEFQIGIFFAPTWNYTNATQYDYIKDAHVNFIQTFYPNDLGMSTEQQMNTVLSLAGERGIKVQVSDYRSANLTDENIDAITAAYKDNIATGGYYVWDEPSASSFSHLARAYNRFLQNDPDCVPNVNLFPMFGPIGAPSYMDYVNWWIDSVGRNNLKYLSFDNYAFIYGYTYRDDYYQNLEYIRSAGISRNVRTACYLQAVGLPQANMRRPVENEMRFDVYSALAYGMKAVYWFTWFQPVIPGYNFSPAIMDANGNKTDLYTPVQTLNSQIKKLGPTLMGLTSCSVFHKGTLPLGTIAVPADFFWQPTTSYNQIISHFVDENNRSYVMVVNRDTANSRTLSFNLPSKPAAVTEVSKTTGSEVATNYNSSTGNLSATFLPGEGKLYAISSDYSAPGRIINDTDPEIVYSGSTWGYNKDRGVGDFNDDVHYATANNSYFEYMFTGTGVDFISEKSNGYGNIDIYIDGVFKQTVSANSSGGIIAQQVLYSISGLPYGTHTIRGVKKSGTYMVIDKFVVHAAGTAIPAPTLPAPQPGQVYQASVGFSSTQGANGWYYQQWDGSTYSNMTWTGSNWKGTDTYCLIGSKIQHPDNHDSVRKWVAPESGTVKITSDGKISVGPNGDGVRVKVLKNNKDIWPSSGWQTIPANSSISFPEKYVNVEAGDALYFIVNKNGTNSYDSTTWDPVITYMPYPVYQASVGFSSTQGTEGWYYQQWDASTYSYSNMTWNSGNNSWKGSDAYCYVFSDSQHPDTRDSVRKWVAPRTGVIRITSSGQISVGPNGDGVNVRVMKGHANVWPSCGWRYIPANSGISFPPTDVSVTAGDELYFIVNKNGTISYDTTNWDPIITYLN